jgi:transcription antitermination factor NusG
MPLPLEESEMNAILQVVQSNYKVTPHPFVAVGAKVRIEEGPLAGLEGIVSGFKNRQIIFSVGLLKRSISVGLDDSAVAMLSTAKSA